MTDIVKRLRDPSKGSPRWLDTLSEAADEIERLREALRNIAQVPRSDAAYGVIQCIARDALGEGTP
jgi:hypothetical protein